MEVVLPVQVKGDREIGALRLHLRRSLDDRLGMFALIPGATGAVLTPQHPGVEWPEALVGEVLAVCVGWSPPPPEAPEERARKEIESDETLQALVRVMAADRGEPAQAINARLVAELAKGRL